MVLVAALRAMTNTSMSMLGMIRKLIPWLAITVVGKPCTVDPRVVFRFGPMAHLASMNTPVLQWVVV
jgi:Mg/Co/Ni transporter MgtE